MPAVAEEGGSPQCRPHVAPDPEREGALHGPRPEMQAVEAEPASLEGLLGVGVRREGQGQHLEEFVGHEPPLLVGGCVDGRELAAQVADADPGRHATVGEDVRGRKLAGQRHGLAQRRHEHVGPQPQPGRRTRTDQAAGHGVEPVGRRQVTGVVRHRHPVAEPPAVVTQVFGTLQQVADGRGLGEGSLGRDDGGEADSFGRLGHSVAHATSIAPAVRGYGSGMDLRLLGRTGVRVSPLCLGAMMFGAWGNHDHDDCVRIVHRALDAGINFIDTADVYSGGESEEIVGKALSGAGATG